MGGTALLELKNVAKVYKNGVVANKNINITFLSGEIHAIVGENGAGKSTLMKIIFGFEKPNKGEIIYKGEKAVFKSPMDAIARGIGMVHQHFMLVPSFTVLENILLGNEPTKLGFLNIGDSRKRVMELAEKYGFTINIDQRVSELSVGMKQKVEILKVLYKGADIIILDEPTAVLTPQETESLFEQLVKFKEMGHTIIFISHKLNEVKQISDRISVMRQGEMISTHNTKDVAVEEISELMIGRKVVFSYDDIRKDTTLKNVLAVKDIMYSKDGKKDLLKNVSFTARTGEILGIIGVEGNGQAELVDIIFGNKHAKSGSITINERDISNSSIKERRNLGIAYIPEDRMRQGIAANGSIKENLIGSFYDSDSINRKIFMDKPKINKIAGDLIGQFEVLCKDADTKIGSLSGGNIQKVVVAREYYVNPDVLIAEQPTRGVDIGSASSIHKKIIELRNANKAVILISADLSEALAVSDRLIVFYSGEIVAYFEHIKEVTEKELGFYMLGLKKQSKEEIRRATHEEA